MASHLTDIFTCDCTDLKEFNGIHEPHCELSNYFALAVDDGINEEIFRADEPKGQGDPTNPQWPDRRDR